MDRRDFFKTLMTTSLLTPLLLYSKKTTIETELYLISNTPQEYLPPLLDALCHYSASYEKTFAFLTSHPQQKEIMNLLLKQNWNFQADFSKACLTFSFSRMENNIKPSFSFMKNGEVLDLRSHPLLSFWERMNKKDSLSAGLTTVSLRKTAPPLDSGNEIAVFKNGKKAGILSLSKETSRVFKDKKGSVKLTVASGVAFIEESSCEHQICRYSQPISRTGERLICAPNHLLISVRGNNSIDTVIG